MKTTLQYAKIQFLRVLRDPVTLIVLFAIPVLLLVQPTPSVKNVITNAMKITMIIFLLSFICASWPGVIIFHINSMFID